MDRRRAAGALLALAACIACSAAAPTLNEHTSLDLYEGKSAGCYYNFQHYGEGDRIMTNEPCLNCTCHNRMLMCYLRVCPFTKAIGQDCTVEKRADQCCPIVTCPDVPVDLLTSTSTTSPAEYGGTGVGKPDKYGCSINGRYFPEGSKVPPTPNKPCEHCYCIRNMTTCVMQECTLHVDGCTPIYHKDVCCPVRYSCDHLDDETLLLDDMTTTVRPTPGFLLTTTISSPVTQMTQDCVHDDKMYADGALIKTEKACEHCYCMKGDIVCVVQECGTPMENEGKNCTSLPPREGQCCPDTYICEGDEIATESLERLTTGFVQDEFTTYTPPRRYGVEGSGYRKEPDNTSYTATPPTETESEGSGYEQKLETLHDSNEITPTTVMYEHMTTKIPINEKIKPEKEKDVTEFSEKPREEYEKTTTISETYEAPVTTEEAQKIIDEYHESNEGLTEIPPLEHTELVTKPIKEEFVGETTQEETSLPEDNISTITPESGSKIKITTETAKQDLGTTINTEENDISVTTSGTIFEESEGVTTDKEHDTVSSMVSEKEKPQVSEYNPSTSSTPFLEEVEKVTTEAQEQHIVTDNISDITETFGLHKYGSTISVPEIEVNKESDTISGSNTLPDTEFHEYIPIATSAPIGDETDKRTTVQEDSVTSDFNEEEIKQPHKNIPSTTNLILEEFITTESSISNEISEVHKHIASTTDISVASEYDKRTTETLQHDIVTDRTRKDDDTYQYTLTTTSIVPMTEESLVTEKEKDERVNLSTLTEIDKIITDKYIPTTISTLNLEDHKTTMKDYDDSKEGSGISEKDYSSTEGLSSSKSVEEASTELYKHETSTSKLEEKESYESHKVPSTSALGVEEDYITTTEYSDKDQEFISHEISQSERKPSENAPDSSSTPFLEEIEKATPEVPEGSISSTVGEPAIHTPEKQLPSKDAITSLDEEITTIIEPVNIVEVTSVSSVTFTESYDSVDPETTQDAHTKHETTIPSTEVSGEKQTYDMDSVTTDASPVSSSSPSSFTIKEDQFPVTTEPSFRKEDNTMQVTSELNRDVITDTPNIESTTIITSEPDETPTASVLPEYIQENKKPVSSHETTDEVNTETVTLNKDNLPVSVDEASIVSTTHAFDKIDLFETTTVNPGENEIQEDLLSSAGRIPGEGDCLLNGVTYRNESVVPSTNKCHSGCRCLSSIITCDPIICSPPPEYMNNCQPTYDSPESCCATYVCDQVRETLPPLPYKHVTTTETPKETISIECQGDECEIRQDKKQPTSVDSSSELCTTSSCSTEFDNQQETSNCGPQGCTSSINNVPSLDTSELCINGKCEQPVVQIHEEELCQGDSCKFVTETHPHGSQEDNKPQEVTSIPCIGDSCTTIQESTNVMTEPQDTAVLCKDENDCSVIDQGCTDDSCRRKEILNIEHKPFCSGVDCEKNQDLPEEPSKDAHYSTYTPDIKPSAEIETTPALSVTSDIITIPSIQHTTDRVPPSDKIPNFISEDQEIVTKLPEIITSSAYPINDFTTLPDIFITESQEPNIDKPQKPIGESHTLESKPPLLDEQNVSSEQSSITATEDTIVNIGYETSTQFSEDKVNKEEETDMKIDELENNLNKPKDPTIVPVLPITDIEKETTTLENAISTSFDTNTKAPLRDVSATTILDTDEDEISTAKPHEYSTSYVNFEEIESGSTIPTHVSGTYEQSSEAPMITNAPVLVPITENEVQVSETKEPLPTLNNQEVTTSARFESENDNDSTTPVDNLELDQVNIITDLPYLHIDADVDNTFKENKLITTAKSDDEVYDTTSHKFSEPTHKTTESILIETGYTESMPIVTSVTDSEVHLTEIDDSRTESPVSTDVEENVNTESPSSYITESGVDGMTDDQTKITLPTFETDDKKTETVSPSAVTESEVHIPEVDVSKTTLSVSTDGGEETEIETSASPITESGSHATVSEEIITPLPTFVTKEENIASYTPVFSVTEGLQIDNIDRTKEISPISVIDEGQIQPETTSVYETESEDEGKTTLKQEKDHIATGTPDFQITESVVYTTNTDEIRTTLPTTYIDKKEKIETSSPSMYVTEPAVHSTETEGTKTTLPTFITKEETVKPEYQSSQVTEKEMFTFPTHERETTFAEYATEHEKAYTEAPSPQFTKIELETTTTFDEIKTTPHTLVTDERVELEFPVTIMTELKPHSDKVTDIETTISTQNTEEEENIIKTQVTQAVEHEQAIDVTSTTLAGQITTERTIQEAVPISPETEPEINLSTLEETRVTIPTYTTETEMIKEEPELPVSPMTILGLHKEKSDESNTVLPTSHVETGTPPSHVTESELHTSDADQTNTLPVAVAEDKNIEPQSISPYVTESGVYATDIDERKSTLSVTTTEKEKLDSEAPISQVTELELQVNDVDETRTTTPSSTIKEDVYVSEIHETKTTIPSSIIKEEKTEDKPTTQATQSVSFETETKVPIYIIDTGNTQSDLAVSTEKEVKLQTNEVIETQPTQSTSVGEEEKNKLVTPSSEVTESKDQTNKLEETKTTLLVSIIDNDNVATETSYSQRTESVTYATGMDETRTTSPAPHLSEEEKIGSESPISDVTGSDIHGTVPIEMSSTVSSLPDVEKNEYETKVPVYHLSDTETYSTAQYETKTTTPAFVITEEIKTEASAIPGIESTDLVTGMIEDENKLTTLSEHIVTESEIQTTEVATIPEIKLEDTNNINVEKEQDGVKLTTELYDYDAHIKPDDTHKRPLTENTTEMEYVENITTDEEIQGTTEFIKVESISSVSPPEIGVTQGNEMETKVPVDGITNEIYPNLHITEEQRLSTDTTESPSIDEETPLTQDHYSKSTELLPATTLTSVTVSEEINTPSIVENVQTPVTASPDIQSFVTHPDVTKESDIYITTSEESVTKKPIDNEQEEVSTELPATSTSYIDVTTHHAVQEQSTVPIITQEELTSSSEQETPYKITLAPESLTTNLQEVSQTNLDEHHIDEEEQTKIKPTTDYTDSSTIKSEIVTISQEQYFTEKQETIPIEHDSSTVSTEITTKKPDAAEINSITTIQTQEETTEHEEIKHVFGPASESTETLPDIVELEEHTHKTLDATTVTSIDDKSTPEKTDLEHQTLEQSTNKASDEQFGIKDTTAINEDTTTSIYDAEKPIATTGLAEETLVETHATTPIISNQEIFTTSKQEETSTSKQEETSSSISTQVSEIENVSIPEASIATEKPLHEDKSGTTTPFDEITLTTLKPTSIEIEKESPTPVATTSIPETKPEDTSFSKVPKPVTSVTASPDEISPQPEEEHLPPSGSSGYGGEPDYVEEDQAFGPGTCRYGGKVYVSAQQIPRDDPCDFCFCFRSDIICLQQSCPPPIHGCHEEPIQGFCCPRYECPVSMATTLNVTTTTTTTTTTLPPHFPTHSYKGAAQRRGCQIKGHTYKVGEVVRASSGPCLHCTCGGDGQMKCDPKACTPEPMLRQMIAAAVSAKRRR